MSTQTNEPTRQYIVGCLHSPAFDPADAGQLDEFISSSDGVRLVRRTAVGRYVLEMTVVQRDALAALIPNIMVEDDQQLESFGMPGLPPKTIVDGEYALSVKVKDAVTGKPISNVSVYGIGANFRCKGLTNKRGMAKLLSQEAFLHQLLCSPLDTYWSKIEKNITIEKEMTLEVELHSLIASGSYDWGRRLIGLGQARRYGSGRGIKIGIIDSGICDTHDNLHPAGGYNFVSGQDPAAWNIDEKGHGTHVAGIIAARDSLNRFTGIASDAEIYSLKVFPGGQVSYLVAAVEWCIQNRMDVICMSLGTPSGPRVLENVLQDAYERGITCVAAAGNESTHIAFPAAFPTVISVGAVGRFGTFPEESGHSRQISRFVDSKGKLFAGSFCNFGDEMDVMAPGVAILSTVPTGYAAWDGTSAACAVVAGFVAQILEGYPDIRTCDCNQSKNVQQILLWGGH